MNYVAFCSIISNKISAVFVVFHMFFMANL